jgi:hypothetical protein
MTRGQIPKIKEGPICSKGRRTIQNHRPFTRWEFPGIGYLAFSHFFPTLRASSSSIAIDLRIK